MDTKAIEYDIKRLDHLGIVAGICREIDLVDMIDGKLATPSGRKVSCGTATMAMVLNGLGFAGRALYLMPEYLENKPVDLLIREDLVASDFNDDTLGRALDELFQEESLNCLLEWRNEQWRQIRLMSILRIPTPAVLV